MTFAAAQSRTSTGTLLRVRPVPQLAEAVVAPALDPARARQRAGVDAAGGDRADAAREPADVDRDVALRVRPVPQLAEEVVAPALDPARARQRAGVDAAGGDRADAARKPADVDRDVAIRGRPVPQLAEGVVAPALDPARARQRAGVGAAGGDRADAAREPADVDRDVAIRGSSRSPAARRRCCPST